MPELIEVAARVRAARAEAPERLKRLADGSSWVEPPCLLDVPGSSDEEEGASAGVRVQAWRARLKDLFPDRRSMARTMGPEETGGTLGLGFQMVLDAAT